MGTNERKRRSNKKQLIFIGCLLLCIPFLLTAIRQEESLGLSFNRIDGSKTSRLLVEVVTTEAARAKGLMFRKELEAHRGMLFIYPDEGVRKFWMKNTPLPLDMVFIDSAFKVVGIVSNTRPFSTKSVGVEEQSKYVLEVNAGIASELAIKEGAVMIPESPLPKASS